MKGLKAHLVSGPMRRRMLSKCRSCSTSRIGVFGFLWAMVLLHGPDGAPAWFRAEEIIYVSKADKVRWGKSANSVVLLHDTWMALAESVDEVLEKIKE